MKKRRWKFATLMNITFICIIVLPGICIGLVVFNLSKEELLNQTSERTYQTLQQVSDSIDQESQKIMNTVATIYNNDRIMDLAAALQQMNNEQDRFSYSSELDDLLNNYFNYTKDLLSGFILYRGGGMYSFKQNSRLSEQEIRRTTFYKRTMEAPEKVQLISDYESQVYGVDQTYLLSSSIAIPIQRGYNNLEMMYFVFRGQTFNNLLKLSSKEEETYLVLDQQNVIFSNQDNYLGESIGQFRFLSEAYHNEKGRYITDVNGTPMVITFLTGGYRGWKIVHLIPYEALTRRQNHLFLVSIFISLLVLVLFLIVSYLIVRNMVRPLERLMKQMSMLGSGYIKSTMTPSGPEEIYVLGNKFNDMVLQIEMLITEIERKERAKTKAEIESLQSQINPHFLINTLNAIKIMAMISKADNIQQMTASLIRLVSSSFNREGAVVSVQEELENLKHYLYIMQIRYGSSIEVVWDIEEAVLDLPMLKMVLQPIVENALVHGFSEMAGKQAVLTVRGRLQPLFLLFEIEDNGIGIIGEQAEDMLRKPSKDQFSGMGVSNVHQRIILNYGSPYGLSVLSQVGRGTCVTVSLPTGTQHIQKEEVGY